MVSLVTADAPDLACLQEVPPWALRELDGWSGYRVVGDVSRPAALGSVAVPAGVSRRVTATHAGVMRSLVSGQAQALLVGEALRVVGRRCAVLNDPSFRREQSARFGLDRAARRAWREPRICQLARLDLADGRTLLVANVHATSYSRDTRLARSELSRVVRLADELAEPGDVTVLAGDFNVKGSELSELVEAGFSEPGPGIDHVLVRGADASELAVWPIERRRHGGLLLSDHAPVELTLE